MTLNTRILLIDDDVELLRMMSIILEKAGFQVDKADDGLVGIGMAEKKVPDLIILDVMMPRMDGLEVCRRLRNQPATRQVPIIMLSAMGEIDDKVKGFTVGADDYISKPVDSKELVLRVYALLNRARMARSASARTVSFVGAKGGVGTTTVALNVAARLAHQRQRVVLAELRPSGGILWRLLRFRSEVRAITPLLALEPDHIKRPEVERCLMSHSSGLQLLLAPAVNNNPLTAHHVEAIFDVLLLNSDYIIFDVPAQLEASHRRALELSDQILLVTEPDWLSVECAQMQMKLLQRWGINERANLVVVERTPLAAGLSRVEIENRVGMGRLVDAEAERWQPKNIIIDEQMRQGVVAAIPPAPDLFQETAREQVPLMLVDPNARPAHALLDLVDWLVERNTSAPLFGINSTADLPSEPTMAVPRPGRK
jgi:pilus assembly protein CpaE